WGGHLAALASEEMDHSMPIPDVYPRGNYLLLFDPLDGSSNIDVNISVGTIFSVLRSPEGVTTPGDEHFLQPGTAQVAAGYCTYGPNTTLVLTVGHGTHAFTLDREVGSSPVGTLSSVRRCPGGVTTPGDEHFLQPGTAQVAAGYCTYAPNTTLVLTVGHGTHAFTLDREVGSFMLTTRGMRIPGETKEFAVNMSNQRHWQPPMQAYVTAL